MHPLLDLEVLLSLPIATQEALVKITIRKLNELLDEARPHFEIAEGELGARVCSAYANREETGDVERRAVKALEELNLSRGEVLEAWRLALAGPIESVSTSLLRFTLDRMDKKRKPS